MSELWRPDASTRLNAVVISPQRFTNLSDLAQWCNHLTVHQQHGEVYKVERVLSVQVIEHSGSYEAVLLCEVLK
jgi:hypothetical protein